ncbi:hypothetical protein QR680_016331 [Steinernema hermaphroditum]|uniref:Uncharacterized protein n=1 Tax=Steinernema hermaphroditum TaxID=289476 RepID=A0AA39HB71_9BILA|nr:hypothetical protein QR680_016331 [Steinernema hermaphroditum]
MWYVLAIAEFSLAIALWGATFILFAAILRKNSLRTLFKNSPPLASVFIACSVSGVLSLCFLSLWILTLEAIHPVLREYPDFMLIMDMLVQCSRFLYDVATLSLFVRRISVLLYPLKPKALTTGQVVATVIIGCAVVAAVVQLYALNIFGDTTPIPEGCFSGLCMPQMKSKYTLAFILRLVLTTSIIVAGTTFLILLHKKNLVFKSAADLRVNKMLQYVFYLRIVIELIPSLLDTILLHTVTVSIASTIGPYTVVGYAIECFASTFLYYKVLSKKTYKIGTTKKYYAWWRSKGTLATTTE